MVHQNIKFCFIDFLKNYFPFYVHLLSFFFSSFPFIYSIQYNYFSFFLFLSLSFFFFSFLFFSFLFLCITALTLFRKSYLPPLLALNPPPQFARQLHDFIAFVELTDDVIEVHRPLADGLARLMGNGEYDVTPLFRDYVSFKYFYLFIRSFNMDICILSVVYISLLILYFINNNE